MRALVARLALPALLEPAAGAVEPVVVEPAERLVAGPLRVPRRLGVSWVKHINVMSGCRAIQANTNQSCPCQILLLGPGFLQLQHLGSVPLGLLATQLRRRKFRKLVQL